MSFKKKKCFRETELFNKIIPPKGFYEAFLDINFDSAEQRFDPITSGLPVQRSNDSVTFP